MCDEWSDAAGTTAAFSDLCAQGATYASNCTHPHFVAVGKRGLTAAAALGSALRRSPKL